MEELQDGHIYFLNTQKLGKAGNLGKHSDNRQYTIWETLENTAKKKADRLYFIIDEAINSSALSMNYISHLQSGGQRYPLNIVWYVALNTSPAGTATSIMQRFIKGSVPHKLSPIPLVIGMSATSARFNQLVGDTKSVIFCGQFNT